jgi:DNA-directed RNA polymerase specialized sigma24 family protein
MSQQAGTTPYKAEFAELAEPFRRELLAHCYRLPGSVEDADDLVQGTDLRARQPARSPSLLTPAARAPAEQDIAAFGALPGRASGPAPCR